MRHPLHAAEQRFEFPEGTPPTPKEREERRVGGVAWRRGERWTMVRADAISHSHLTALEGIIPKARNATGAESFDSAPGRVPWRPGDTKAAGALSRGSTVKHLPKRSTQKSLRWQV